MEVKIACTMDREQYLADRCEKIDEMLKKNDSRGAFALTKGMTQKTGIWPCWKDGTREFGLLTGSGVSSYRCQKRVIYSYARTTGLLR